MNTNELNGAALDWAVAKSAGNTGNFTIDGYSPSTDWSQGGPIIERERIELRGDGDEGWIADDNLNPPQWGPTPLIAAMRCYVASKLGETVDVPGELC